MTDLKWSPAELMMLLLWRVNKLIQRNKSKHTYADIRTLWQLRSTEESLLLHNPIKKTHTLFAVTTIAERAWAKRGHALILFALGESCHPCVVSQKNTSSHQTFNQNLFHNQNMHAQIVLKDFQALNLLLSCFSFNWFKMLSMQVFWDIAWCMRLIYKCNSGNICLMGLMLGNTCLKFKLALTPYSATLAGMCILCFSQ